MTGRENKAPHSPVSGDGHFRVMAWTFRLRDVFRPPVRLLREAGVKPGQTVLDFGCGPGSFSLAAAGLVGNTGRVLAYDIHPLAIRTVESRACRRGLKNLQAVLSEGVNGLAEGAVDVALLYDVLHEVGDPSALSAELHRVMRPGGLLSFHDHFMREETVADLFCRDDLFRLLRRGRYTRTFQRIPRFHEGSRDPR